MSSLFTTFRCGGRNAQPARHVLAVRVLFKAVGCDEGFQHAHTVKVVRWSHHDTYLIDLTDDCGRRFHIELIFPDQEPDLASDWRRWRRYKPENRDRFERIDAGLLAEHVRIAEEWK